MLPVDDATLIEPAPGPDSPDFPAWLENLVEQLNEVIGQHGYVINQLINGVLTTAQLQVSYSPPVGVEIGWVAYADGTMWNPGAGEGLYVYKSDNAWHKIA